MALKRYVIVQERLGIFMGLGMGGVPFWSKVDAGGQDCSPSFDTVGEIEEFIEEENIFGPQVPEYRCVLVELFDDETDDHGFFFATMDDLEKAGLEEYFGTMRVTDLSKLTTHPSVQ